MSLETQIGPDTFVTLAYTLFDADGDVLDQADATDPLTYVHGYGQIVPGLERAIEGLAKGQHRSVLVEPEDGYGDYDDEGVFEVEKTDFPNPEGLHVEDEFVAESPDGEQIAMRVLEVRGDAVLVDTNHPLAGEVLRFEVQVLDVRPATDEEIATAEAELDEDNHIHGPDCDHEHEDGAAHEHAEPHAHDSDHEGLVSIGKKPSEHGPS